MTPCRTAVLAAAALCWAVATPAGADGLADAAATSFSLQSGDRVQPVDLVAAREEAGDVLLLRVRDCRGDLCLDEQAVLPLDDGELVLGADRASLTATLSGRALAVTWTRTDAGMQLSGPRLRGEGVVGDTSAQGFTGRSAEVRVVLDGAACATTGALGSSARVTTGDAPADPVQLGRGSVRCTAEEQ